MILHPKNTFILFLNFHYCCCSKLFIICSKILPLHLDHHITLVLVNLMIHYFNSYYACCQNFPLHYLIAFLYHFYSIFQNQSILCLYFLPNDHYLYWSIRLLRNYLFPVMVTNFHSFSVILLLILGTFILPQYVNLVTIQFSVCLFLLQYNLYQSCYTSVYYLLFHFASSYLFLFHLYYRSFYFQARKFLQIKYLVVLLAFKEEYVLSLSYLQQLKAEFLQQPFVFLFLVYKDSDARL